MAASSRRKKKSDVKPENGQLSLSSFFKADVSSSRQTAGFAEISRKR